MVSPALTDLRTGAEENAPDYLAHYQQLPRKRRLKVGLAAAFVVWHVAVTLIWGAGDKVRESVKPALSWYAGGLKLGGTWGMFAAPARMHVVFVYGVTADRQRVLVSPDPNSSWYQAMVDMRERKMRSRLGDKEQRDFWGAGYLDSFCERRDGSWFQRIELESAEHDELHRWGKRTVLLTRSCYYVQRNAERAQRESGQKSGRTP